MRNHTGILITCLAFMTLAAWMFATDRLEYNPVVIKAAAKQDCNEEADPMTCVAERNMAGR